MRKLVDVLMVVIVLGLAGVLYLLLATDLGEDLDLMPAKDTPAPPGAVLPVMDRDDLRALLPARTKMAAIMGVEAQPEEEDESMSDQLPELRSTWPEGARRLEDLIVTYGLDQTVSDVYDYCHLTDYPIGFIKLSADQLGSPELARQFIDDPQALGMFTMFGTTYQPSANVHGWDLQTEPVAEDSCYPSEVTHSLVFEYWGVLFSVDIKAQADASRAELQPLFDQLGSIMVMRVNVMTTAERLAATPVPPAVAVEPAPVVFPITLGFLEDVMPANDIFGDDSSLALNRAVSRSYTLDEYMTAFQDLGLSGIADALAQVGPQTGMVGQVARVWDTQGACPADSMLLALEMDFALFDSASGTLDYLNNRILQTAWLATGAVTEYSPVDRDTLFIHGGYANHRCGPVEVTEMRQAYGRVLAAIAFTHYPGIPQSDIQGFMTDSMAEFDTLFASLE